MPLDSTRKQELMEAFKKGLPLLTDAERYTLFLSYYEELTPEEVMLVLEISGMEYQKLLANAKTKMRAFTDIFDLIDKKFGTKTVPEGLLFR